MTGRDGHLGHLPHQSTCIKRTYFPPFHYDAQSTLSYCADNWISAECVSAWTIKDNSLHQEQMNFTLRAAAGHITPAKVRKFCRDKVLSEQHGHSEHPSCVLLSWSYRQKNPLLLSHGDTAELQRYKPPQTQLSSPSPHHQRQKMNHTVRGKKPSWKCAETIEACHSSSLKAGSMVVTEALWDLLG